MEKLRVFLSIVAIAVFVASGCSKVVVDSSLLEEGVDPSLVRVTLQWDPPLTFEDGSALTDLTGYKLYYGTASGVYSQSVAIAGGQTVTYTLNNLPPGMTYYFALSAISASGGESAYSNEAVAAR